MAAGRRSNWFGSRGLTEPTRLGTWSSTPPEISMAPHPQVAPPTAAARATEPFLSSPPDRRSLALSLFVAVKLNFVRGNRRDFMKVPTEGSARGKRRQTAPRAPLEQRL